MRSNKQDRNNSMESGLESMRDSRDIPSTPSAFAGRMPLIVNMNTKKNKKVKRGTSSTIQAAGNSISTPIKVTLDLGNQLAATTTKPKDFKYCRDRKISDDTYNHKGSNLNISFGEV